MKLYRSLGFLVILLFFTNSQYLQAQTGSLYGATVDESAILVRVLNGRTSGSVQIRIGAHRLSAPNPGDATSYVPIPADVFMLRYENQSIEFLPQVQTMYTLLAYDRGIRIMEDSPHRDPARAQIYFYVSPNLSFQDIQSLELKTTDGNQSIISPTIPGSSNSIAVNPLSISVAAFISDNTPDSRVPWADPIELAMARGQSYTLLALVHANGQPGLQLHQARVTAP